MERNVAGKQETATVILASLADNAQFSPRSIINNKQDFGTKIVETDSENARGDGEKCSEE